MQRSRSFRRGRSNQVASYLLVATVVLAPLPFGSTSPVFVSIWCIVLGVALALTDPRRLGTPHRVALAVLAVPVVIVLAVAAQQISPVLLLPGARPNPIWAEAEALLDTSLPATISVVRNEPFFALGPTLLAVLAFATSLVLGVDEKRANRLVVAIAWSGAAYAAYGIASFTVSPYTVLGVAKIGHFNDLTGTFTNRNTAAIFFGSCAILWLLIAMKRLFRHARGAKSWREVLEHSGDGGLHSPLAAVGLLVLCLTATLMTNSRAGIFLSFAFALGGFGLALYRRSGGLATIVIRVAAAAGLLLVILEALGGGVSRRLTFQGLGGDGREETYKATWRMITESPWYGTGLGTYEWAYPPYRGDEVTMLGVWTKAHSTILELAADLGLPVMVLVTVALAGVLGVLLASVLAKRSGRTVPIAALAVSLLAFAHSAIDFSLQIPAIATMVFALLGAGLAQALNPETETPRRRRS